jgi:hypothetical protein
VLRYLTAAIALKAFSLNEATQKSYRALANMVGSRARTKAGLSSSYIETVKDLVRLLKTHVALRPGMKIMEVGTGWVHFYGLFIRLLCEVEITLVDVWDNRQLSALKRYFGDLENCLDDSLGLAPAQIRNGHRLLKIIQAAESFEEIYFSLDAEYIIDTSCVLAPFSPNTYDAIVSFGVLEHIYRENVSELIGNMTGILKSGGIQIHHIVTNDHLVQYDPKVSAKNYLRYSNKAWRLFFENKVQYINRIQRSEWYSIFSRSGLTPVAEVVKVTPVDNLKISKAFSHLSKEDWEATVVTLLLQKGSNNST